MHCFPSNCWRSQITNRKESDKCELCKALCVSQGRFTTETGLPVQTLGHIQHTCEVLSELHTMTHHRCCRLIHGELSRLASLTQTKKMQRKKGIPHEQITQSRLWNKRPDGITFKIIKMTTNTKVGVIWLLEFERMSDVTNHYIVRVKREVEVQYESLRSALANTMQRQGWMVGQVSFIEEHGP